ncbi:MAG: hypothetical protein U0271_33900 [Polyangiaceae bacterium]
MGCGGGGSASGGAGGAGAGGAGAGGSGVGAGGSTGGTGGAAFVGEDAAGPWDTFDMAGNQTGTVNVTGKIVIDGSFTTAAGTCSVSSATAAGPGSVGIHEGDGLGSGKFGFQLGIDKLTPNKVELTFKAPGLPVVGKAYTRDEIDSLNFYCKDANGSTITFATSSDPLVFSKFDVAVSEIDATTHTLGVKLDWEGTQGTTTSFKVTAEGHLKGP